MAATGAATGSSARSLRPERRPWDWCALLPGWRCGIFEIWGWHFWKYSRKVWYFCNLPLFKLARTQLTERIVRLWEMAKGEHKGAVREHEEVVRKHKGAWGSMGEQKGSKWTKRALGREQKRQPWSAIHHVLLLIHGLYIYISVSYVAPTPLDWNVIIMPVWLLVLHP